MFNNSQSRLTYSTAQNASTDAIGHQSMIVQSATKEATSITSIQQSIKKSEHIKSNLKYEKLNIKIPNDLPCPQVKCFSTKNSSFALQYLKHEPQISLQPSYKIAIPNNEIPKFSTKKYGIVKCYAANTNQGIVRYIIN